MWISSTVKIEGICYFPSLCHDEEDGNNGGEGVGVGELGSWMGSV
jgi:hypothetical protein